MLKVAHFLIVLPIFGVSLVAVQAAPSTKPLEPEAPTGSLIRVDPEAIEGQRRASVVTSFARCVVSRSPSKTDYFLRHSDSEVIDDRLGELTKFLPLPDCLGSANPFANATQARMDKQTLRVWLAEAAYVKANKSFVPLAGDVPPVAARAYFAQNAQLQLAKAKGEFADCLVSRDTSGADTLLRTKRASKEEMAAAKKLARALGACLPAGQSLTFNAETIRGYAADGLWQRYEAGKPATFKGLI